MGTKHGVRSSPLLSAPILSHTRKKYDQERCKRAHSTAPIAEEVANAYPTIYFPLLIALCLLSGGLLVGCGGQGAVNSQPDSVVAAPILLRDASPRQLEAYIQITMGGYERATRETTNIELSFSSNGRLVQFASNEHLTCNGVDVFLHNQVASFQIVEAPTSTLEGKTYSCTYAAGGASATLTFTVPKSPAIRSPQDQAQVSRSTHTLITYLAQGGELMGIVALSPSMKAIAQLDTPGLLQATVDTSAFLKGEGSISLTQTLAPRINQTGVSFKSFGAAGTAMTMVAVTWV